MFEIFSKEEILQTYNHLRSKKNLDRDKSLPIGVDGVSADVFEKNLNFSLNEIHRKLQISNGQIQYQFGPLLRIERTKSQGGIRALHIPRLRDQIVFRLLHNEIKKLAEIHGIQIKVTSPYSYVNRFHLHLQNRKDAVVLKTDISRFYDSVPRHKALLICKNLGMRKELFELISNWSEHLKIRDGNFSVNRNYTDFLGLPQGLSISSLLAELYVKPIDHAFSSDTGYFRYVDDILILCDNVQEAYEKLDILRNLTEGLQLKLSSNKTEIVKVSGGFEWLGLLHNTNKIIIPPEKLARTIKPIGALQKECFREICHCNTQEEKIVSVRKLIKQIDKFTNGRNNVRLKWYSLCEDTGQWKKLDSYIHGIISSCLRKAGLSRNYFGKLPSVHAKVLSYKKIKESQKPPNKGNAPIV